MTRTVDDDLSDEDAADGPGVGHKVEGALQGGQAPGHIGLPAREQRAPAQRPVQRPHQHACRHGLRHTVLHAVSPRHAALAPICLGAADSAAARLLHTPTVG